LNPRTNGIRSTSLFAVDLEVAAVSMPSIVLLAVLGATQPSGAQAACQPDAAPIQAVRAVAEGIVDADNARDLDRVRSSYAPDALLLPPNEAPVRGWDAIRPRYEALFSAFTPAIEGHIDDVCVSGALAYVRGRNGGRFVPRDQGTARTLNDTYLMLLHRDARGRWQISHLMWHPAAAASRN
jgi:uncharacterized protein (TIGR02246 family)